MRLIIIVLATLTYASMTIAQAQTIRYNTGDPLQFGVGYNTLTGSYAGSCMTKVNLADIKPAGAGSPDPGQLSKWELTSVQDLTSLTEKMDFSASASASFIAGSVSASSAFTKTKSFNTFHQFLYVNATVANTTQIWTAPQLTPEMLKLRQHNPLAFLDRCGDAFVKTITDGGELTAVLDLSTSASEDTSSLSVSISGNYGSAEGRATLKQQLQQTLLNRQTKVTVIRDGGAGNLPSYSADELIAASLIFPDTIKQHPVPAQAQLASYNTIASPASLTTVQEAYIQPLFRAYRRAMQYSGDLAYAKSHTAEFRILRAPPATKEGAPAPSKAEVEANTALAVATMSKQKIISADFVFEDIDKDELDKTIDNYDSYIDKLGSLAKVCLNAPKTGCTGDVPPLPPRIQNLVRTFEDKRDWDTKAGPVSIILDSSWVCRVATIIGSWRIADAPTAPVLPCETSLPHTVKNGYIIVGGFDGPNDYFDNHGVCTYQFRCIRR